MERLTFFEALLRRGEMAVVLQIFPAIELLLTNDDCEGFEILSFLGSQAHVKQAGSGLACHLKGARRIVEREEFKRARWGQLWKS